MFFMNKGEINVKYFTFGTDENHVTVKAKNLTNALTEVRKLTNYGDFYMNLRTVENVNKNKK